MIWYVLIKNILNKCCCYFFFGTKMIQSKWRIIKWLQLESLEIGIMRESKKLPYIIQMDLLRSSDCLLSTTLLECCCWCCGGKIPSTTKTTTKNILANVLVWFCNERSFERTKNKNNIVYFDLRITGLKNFFVTTKLFFNRFGPITLTTTGTRFSGQVINIGSGCVYFYFFFLLVMKELARFCW